MAEQDPSPIDYAASPPPQREPQPAPHSVSGKRVLLWMLAIALLFQVAIALFVWDVRRRRPARPAQPVPAQPVPPAPPAPPVVPGPEPGVPAPQALDAPSPN